jgi:hypothetical protein
VNWKRLTAIGVQPDARVSLSGAELTVRGYLDQLMLQVNGGEAKLGYEAGRNLIHIASRQDLNQELTTRVYPIGDLLRSYKGRPAQLFVGRVQDYVTSIDPYVAAGVAMPRPIIAHAGSGIFLDLTEPGAPYDESVERERERLAAELVAAITGAVEPETWEVNGGRGTVRVFQEMLIVRNTSRVHQILGGALASGEP